MAKYELDEEDYELSEMERWSNYLSGMGTGASSGAMIGTAIAPGVGTAIGAGEGGLAGLGVGIGQNVAQRKALEAAYENDLKIQERLSEVDYMEDFMTTQAALATGREEEAEMSARQAATRAGLSGGAAEDFARSAKQDVALAKSAALASAVPAAARADIAERQRIMQEEVTRQALYDEVSTAPDYLGGFGQFAGMATQATQVATGTGGAFEGGLEGYQEGQVAAEEKRLSDELAELEASSISHGVDLAAARTEEETATLSTVFGSEAGVDSSGEYEFENSSFYKDAFSLMGSEEGFEKDINDAKDYIAASISSGTITEEEILQLREESPLSLTSIERLDKGIANLRYKSDVNSGIAPPPIELPVPEMSAIELEQFSAQVYGTPYDL